MAAPRLITTTTPSGAPVTEGEALAQLINAAEACEGWWQLQQPYRPLPGPPVFSCILGTVRRGVEGKGLTPLAAMCDALRQWTRLQG